MDDLEKAKSGNFNAMRRNDAARLVGNHSVNGPLLLQNDRYN